jgi:transcriptional regulator with XRE-family HTH domain
LPVTEFRVLRGWNQAELAERAGLSLSAVRDVEEVKSRVPIGTLSCVAAGLGVPVEALLRERRSIVN